MYIRFGYNTFLNSFGINKQIGLSLNGYQKLDKVLFSMQKTYFCVERYAYSL